MCRKNCKKNTVPGCIKLYQRCINFLIVSGVGRVEEYLINTVGMIDPFDVVKRVDYKVVLGCVIVELAGLCF